MQLVGIGGLLPRPLLNWVPIFCWLTGLVSIVGLWFRASSTTGAQGSNLRL